MKHNDIVKIKDKNNERTENIQKIENIDVLIVGAGLSGIDAAYRIQTECPQKSFAILEARNRIGGTWDLFRYPGIRSDSDVETLGFPFKAWIKQKSIADGPSIRNYIEEAARDFAIDKKIRFGWKVTEANWLSQKNTWHVQCIDHQGNKAEIYCNFFYCCTGYYNYSEAYTPQYPDKDKFKGTFIHPQFWPESYDVSGKKIVVIGSGATAITLIPSLAEKAQSVMMLQRSPTYIVARPAIDPMTEKIKSLFPTSMAHRLIRMKNILYSIYVYRFAKKKPELTRKILMKMAKRQLPAGMDMEKNFNPSYQPWDQRLCLAPDGDFFRALNSKHVDIETDEIERFDENGIVLRSGKHLEADVIVSATGLKLQLVGGIKIYKDSALIELNQHLSYKGVMLSYLPNFAFAFGYTNATWTLKCDLSARYVCRVLNYMDKRNYRVAYPNIGNAVTRGDIKVESLLNLNSGYIKRSETHLPKQGNKKPWRLHQNYFWDWVELGLKKVNDGTMQFF